MVFFTFPKRDIRQSLIVPKVDIKKQEPCYSFLKPQEALFVLRYRKFYKNFMPRYLSVTSHNFILIGRKRRLSGSGKNLESKTIFMKELNWNDNADISGIVRLFATVLICLLFLNPTSSNAQVIKKHTEQIERAGDIILVALPATAAATTLVLKDKKGSWQFTKSFLMNAAVTLALKYGVNKRRPFDGGYQAFPSGHTSITFQSASFIHRRYGFKYSIPGYLLAAYTGYSRIYATRHDGWDVLAGAVVGIGSTYLFTTPYQRERMQLTFSSGEGQYLLGFIYKF